MSERSHENTFKFGVYQGGSAISERIFSADVFNPVIRYSVDIREMIPSIINKLQRTLSRKNINTHFDVGYQHEGDNIENMYDLIALYKKTLDGKVPGYVNKLTRPPVVSQVINNKTITGVECKFGLYINGNPIVERNFYVDQYNPASRFSLEIVEAVNDLADDITNHLKRFDVKHMWDDYDMINIYGIYIHQIRELSKDLRRKMLANTKNPSYVKQMRSHFRRRLHHSREQ